VMSTLYPDGTVAAMEELIGNHGGLGGEQTDAFIFHSMDMPVPETSNSADVFGILNSRRGLPGAPAVPEKPAQEHVDAWALGTLLKGIGQVKKWVTLALRAIILQGSAFQQIAKDDYMTGPALLLGIVGPIIFSSIVLGIFTWQLVLIQIAVWFVTVLLMYIAGRLLRGNGTYTSVVRAVGFAQGIYILEMLSLIPALAPIVRLLVPLLAFLALWLGVASAHGLKGWRTLVLPVIYLCVVILGFVIIYSTSAGFTLSIETLEIDFGLLPPR
jgi:hypothetical protein